MGINIKHVIINYSSLAEGRDIPDPKPIGKAKDLLPKCSKVSLTHNPVGRVSVREEAKHLFDWRSMKYGGETIEVNLSVVEALFGVEVVFTRHDGQTKTKVLTGKRGEIENLLSKDESIAGQWAWQLIKEHAS